MYNYAYGQTDCTARERVRLICTQIYVNGYWLSCDALEHNHSLLHCVYTYHQSIIQVQHIEMGACTGHSSNILHNWELLYCWLVASAVPGSLLSVSALLRTRVLDFRNLRRRNAPRPKMEKALIGNVISANINNWVSDPRQIGDGTVTKLWRTAQKKKSRSLWTRRRSRKLTSLRKETEQGMVECTV